MDKNVINKSALSFPVMFQKVEDIEGADCRFTKVKIWLMHLGKNFNGSVFEKEVVDNAIPTLGYIPITAFIEDNKLGEKDCSDHRYVITRDKDGITRKYKGVAYGVITSNEDNNAHYEERLCDDGETRTFLVVDGLIWNVFEDASEIINRDMIKNQSMELWDDEDSVEGYEDENGLFHFTKFSFRAACILGNDYEPAMINSTVEVQFAIKDFVKHLQRELDDKMTTFSKLSFEKSKQGGNNVLDTNFTQTLQQQFADISVIVSNYATTKDYWGDEIPRYYLVDIQDNEVIVVDRNDAYRYYGFTFTMNGDKPEIDFASGKRKKVCYEDYVEGTSDDNNTFNFGKHITEIEEKAFAKVTEANTKVSEAEQSKTEAETNYTNIKADYDEIKPKYDEYVKAEQERIEKETTEKKDALFARFESVLGADDGFMSLKSKRDEMSVQEIEDKCSVMYARKNLDINFSAKSKKSLTVEISEFEDDKQGFVSTKYGNIPIKD